MHRNFSAQECPFYLAQYKLYNVGGATAVRIVTTGTNARVWRNDAAGDLGTISRNGVLETSAAKGDVFYCCEPIWGVGESGTFDVTLVPDYTAGSTVAGTISRSGSIQIELYSLGATSAQVYRNGGLVSTIALTPNAVTTFTQGNPYTGSWRVDANGPVMAFKRTQSGADSSIMATPTNRIIGWASSAAYIGKETSSATSQQFTAYSHRGNYTGNIATTYNIINSADLPHSGAQGSYYDPNVGMVAVGANGINLHGNSRADADGGNDTAFLPTSWMRTLHKLPQPCEFASINSLTNAPVEVRNPDGSLLTTLTPTKVNTDPNAPYSVRYGTPNNAANIPIGTEFYSTSPIQIVAQAKGGGAFGSDDDEFNSFGYNLNP